MSQEEYFSINQTRKAFLDFFKSKNHSIVPSSPLSLYDDKSLLFTNAGMVPFKEYFLGNKTPPFKTATSCQMCMRAGGKHNDLDNVGFTSRHHTFFEMLGSFSFGEYFKKQAILYAWEFLTEVLKIPKNKLIVTVFEQDNESYSIWQNEIGLPEDRVIRLGKESNFWQMGSTGPCGPCSEIFYDHGEEIFGDIPGSKDEDGDRFVEIWNMVFMQFERKSDNRLVDLPVPCVDTGMGLERITSLLQNTHDNYKTDAFTYLLEEVDKAFNVENKDKNTESGKKVIVDHIRSAVFLLSEKISPDNEGRGYVLRRIIRRSLRFAYLLKLPDLFFSQLATKVIENMGALYPEIVKNKDFIILSLQEEEELFTRTLESGMLLIEQYLSSNKKNQKISGEVVFKLHDTYGFPPDLTAVIASERNYILDMDGYKECMKEQKLRSKSANKFISMANNLPRIDEMSKFVGYDKTKSYSVVKCLFDLEGNKIDKISENNEGMVVLNTTPFYAESGGQVGDIGVIFNDVVKIVVKDVQKTQEAIIHFVEVKKGSIVVEDAVETSVEVLQRNLISANHSATHLLHSALYEVLGEHIEQKGSLVNAEKLRFDFSHKQPLSIEEKEKVEKIINNNIRSYGKVESEEMPYDKAIGSGAKALFSEKYGDKVRVVSMGGRDTKEPCSIEFCGGTHVKNLSHIGCFHITSESALSSGVRRIEATTNINAIDIFKNSYKKLNKIKKTVKANTEDEILEKINQLVETNAKLEKEVKEIALQSLLSSVDEWCDNPKSINDVAILVKRVDEVGKKNLLLLVDRLKNKLQTYVIVVANIVGDRVQLSVFIDKKTSKIISAKTLLNYSLEQIGGKGGGKDDMAQGGGNMESGFENMLANCQKWIDDNLTK